MLHLAQHEWERAEIFTQAALQLDKEDCLPWFLLFDIYTNLGRDKEVVNCDWECKRLAVKHARQVEWEVSRAEGRVTRDSLSCSHSSHKHAYAGQRNKFTHLRGLLVLHDRGILWPKQLASLDTIPSMMISSG
jgi:hypothetical protein